MLNDDRSDRVLDGEILDADEPGGVELVPLAQPVRRTARLAIARPDASFVTHLIATAAQAPQTRPLRRGSLTDAQTAYGAGRVRPTGTGFRTRQVI